jgi:hypothetical protein
VKLVTALLALTLMSGCGPELSETLPNKLMDVSSFSIKASQISSTPYSNWERVDFQGPIMNSCDHSALILGLRKAPLKSKTFQSPSMDKVKWKVIQSLYQLESVAAIDKIITSLDGYVKCIDQVTSKDLGEDTSSVNWAKVSKFSDYRNLELTKQPTKTFREIQEYRESYYYGFGDWEGSVRTSLRTFYFTPIDNFLIISVIETDSEYMYTNIAIKKEYEESLRGNLEIRGDLEKTIESNLINVLG